MIALYVMVYTAGRGWIEYLRIDYVELHDVFGLRFNVWMSIICFAIASAYFVWACRFWPGQETEIYTTDPESAPGDEDDEDVIDQPGGRGV